jgi:hypothetical protein
MVGQRISLDGELVWGPNGIEIGAMLPRPAAYPAVGIDNDGNPAFFYMEQTNGQKDYASYAQKRTPTGDSLWNVNFTRVSGEDGRHYEQSSLIVLPFSQNQWIALWDDNRPEALDYDHYDHVWGQNILKNGTLGNMPAATEISAKANKGNTRFFVANNPVSGETSFIVKGLKGQKAEISILNTIGKTVATAFKGTAANVEDVVVWNASSLSKGIYVAALRTANGVETIKLVVK